jgi:Acetyltransferase (isoleucine patch superfamily)
MLIKKIRRLIFHIRLNFADTFQKPAICSRFYGIKMGSNIRFTGKINFGTEPFLVELGNDITLAEGVTFHTHDGGVWVFRKDYPGINIYKRINIGNNVFVGAYTNILPGVHIGDNVVVGACSVVTKDLPPNGVYAGVPARFIRPIQDYKDRVLANAMFMNPSGNFKEQVLASVKKQGRV